MQKLYGMQFALGQNLVSTNAIFGYQLNGTILKCKKLFARYTCDIYAIYIYIHFGSFWPWHHNIKEYSL